MSTNLESLCNLFTEKCDITLHVFKRLAHSVAGCVTVLMVDLFDSENATV